MKEKIENSNSKPSIEKSANFEGNDTLLLLERLNNNLIKTKLVDMFFKYQKTLESEFIYEVDENDQFIKIPNPDWKPEYKSREEIIIELKERINKVFSYTNINMSKDSLNHAECLGDVGLISPNSINPENGEKLTTKQLSIIEAHEKGHGVRAIFSPHDEIPEISSCIDLSNVEFPENLKKIFTNDSSHENNTPETNIREYFNSPNEIIERMSQLKNYFSMNGDQEFTKAHLDYAKSHYASDTGMGIQIKPFLDGITPETEVKFLELINNLGI